MLMSMFSKFEEVYWFQDKNIVLSGAPMYYIFQSSLVSRDNKRRCMRRIEQEGAQGTE